MGRRRNGSDRRATATCSGRIVSHLDEHIYCFVCRTCKDFFFCVSIIDGILFDLPIHSLAHLLGTPTVGNTNAVGYDTTALQ